jgi:hypothetical protein
MSFRERIILFIMGLTIFCGIWVVVVDSLDGDGDKAQVQTQLEQLQTYYNQLSEKAMTKQEKQILALARADIAEAPFLDHLRPAEYRRKMAQARKKRLENRKNTANVKQTRNDSDSNVTDSVNDEATQTESEEMAAELAMVAEMVRKKVVCSGILSLGDQKMVVLNGREYAVGEVVKRVDGGAIVVDEIHESRVWLRLKYAGGFANQRIELGVPGF